MIIKRKRTRRPLYKILDPGGRPRHGGYGSYSMPSDDKPGAWMPRVRYVAICSSGYHLVNLEHVLEWYGSGYGCDAVPEIFLAQGRGTRKTDRNKHVFRQARLIKKLNWDHETFRHWAADVIEKLSELALGQNLDHDTLARAAELLRLGSLRDSPRLETDDVYVERILGYLYRPIPNPQGLQQTAETAEDALHDTLRRRFGPGSKQLTRGQEALRRFTVRRLGDYLHGRVTVSRHDADVTQDAPVD